jgi:hypothetical protein
MRQIWRCFLAFSLACGAAAQAQAAIRFDVQVEKRVAVAEGASYPGPRSSSARLGVVLSEDAASVSEGDIVTIDDFRLRREVRIDRKAGTYAAWALYAIPAFRERELANRLGIARALDAAGVKQPVGSRADAEHVLSMTDGGTQPIEARAEAGDQVFSAGGHELLRASAGGAALGEQDAARFVRFLRYRFGGHPQALAWLGAQHRLPARLVYRLRDAGAETVETITFSGVGQLDAAPYDLAPYRQAGAETTPVEQLLAGGERLFARPPSVANGLRERIQRGFDEGRPLDAILAFMELNLTAGEAMPRLTPAQQQLVQSDADTQALIAATATRDRATMPAAIATFVRLEQKTIAGLAMLKVFAANDMAQTGDRQGALANFVAALRARPYLAGAYKDLGDLLYLRFDMPGAWRSWDIGRRLSPRLPQFGSIRQFETALVVKYPEYF